MALGTRYGKRGLLEFLHYSGDMTVRMRQVTATETAGRFRLVHLLRQELPYRLKIFHLVHYYVIVRRLYTECLEDSKQLLKAVTGVSLFLFFQPFDLVLRKKMKAKNWLKTSIERSYKTRVSLEALKRFTISNSRAT